MSWIIVTEEEQHRQHELMMADFRRHAEERAKMPKRTKCPCCGAVTSRPWEDLFSEPVMGKCPNKCADDHAETEATT